jgi:molybdopterin-containing oxidoreductase family iron-sulfur binding subunit
MKTLSVVNNSKSSSSSKGAHWRSFEHLQNTESFQNEADHEFAHGQDDLQEGDFNRRDALKLMGASLALAGASTACVRRPEETILPYTKQPEEVIPGVATYYATSYNGPDGAVGMLVESHEGRPTKTEGNPDHPQSLGRADMAMQASVLEMYDPDRSKTVLSAGKASSWADWDTNHLAGIRKLLSQGGQGVAFLTDGTGGPTFERVAGEIKKAAPGASWYAYDPLRWDNAYLGAELAFGNGARVHYDLSKASRIVSLDADFLNDGPEHLKNAAGFGDGRGFDRIKSAADVGKMNRVYAIEATFTVTGSSADHRLRVASHQVGGFAKALGKELLEKNGASVPASLGGNGALAGGLSTSFKPSNPKFLTALAKDLAGNEGKSVIIAGPRQPAAVHALAHMLNAALGALDSGVATVTRGVGPMDRAMPIPTGTGGAADPHADVDLSEGDAPAEGEAPAVVATPAAPALPAYKSGFAQLAELKKALDAGQVNALVILGPNPVYTAPGALGFAEAMKKAKTIVHAGLYADETAELSTLHLPLAHGMETWGDAMSFDGTLTVSQPIIQPLHGGRSALELLGQLAGRPDYRGKALVEETWKKSHSLADADWRRLLHDGATRHAHRKTASLGELGRSGAAAAVAGALGGVKDEGPGDGNLEIIFTRSNTLLDGRHANLGWQQEMPDPMTKLCWDNAVLVGPSLAKKLGVKSRMKKNLYFADIAKVSANGKTIEGPIFVLPGMASHTVALELGYGRANGGTVAEGVGFDVNPLRAADGSGHSLGAKIELTGRQVDLCSTQDHFAIHNDPIQEIDTLDMRGRPIAQDFTASEYSKNPTAPQAAANTPKNLLEKKDKQLANKPLHPLQMATLDVTENEWTYDGQAWGMTFDLTACIGCHACAVACQSENSVSVVGRKWVEFGREMHWLRIDRYYAGDVDEPKSVSQGVPCMHCENAPCEPVCPFTATVHDSEGVNSMVYNRCAGTRYCANNCPYKVRRFNYFDYSNSGNLYISKEAEERNKTLEMQMNPDVTVRYRGTMEKCSYCTQRIQEAKKAAKRRGEDHNNLPDGAVTPACVQTCPTKAISFGNINGKSKDGKPFEIAQRKMADRHYEMLSELNVRPRTTYLAKIRNTNPELV